MDFKFEVIPKEVERKSLKAFKEWICNHYRVKSVNNLPMSTKEYAEYMIVFEAGYSAKSQEIIDRLINNAETKSDLEN